MAVDYRDEKPFDDSEHTMEEIAEAIRHKMYGKDVREAIAQGFELMYKKINSITTKKGRTTNNASLERRLNARLDRITMGTDSKAVNDAVEKALRERGM